MSDRRHPIQPLEKDANGVLRFKANAIVRYLLDQGPFNLNFIAIEAAEGRFSREDQEQFAQLIGYSHSGAYDLDYMSKEVLAAAEQMAEDVPELDARNDYLRTKLADIKSGIRKAVADLYGIHPDDLQGGDDD